MGQIKDIDNIVTSDDLDTTTPNKAVVKKIAAGSGISIASTGVDPGTGVVTITNTGGGGGGGVTCVNDKSSNNTITGLINGTNKTFNLSNTPADNSLILAIKGMVQENVTDYTISGNIITFVVAPWVGATMQAFYTL